MILLKQKAYSICCLLQDNIMNPMDNFKNPPTVRNTGLLESIVRSYWKLMLTIGVGGVIISLIVLFVQLMGAGKRQEAKTGIITKLIILIVLMGGVGILGLYGWITESI